MTREQSVLIGLLGCALRGERPEAGLLAGVDQELLRNRFSLMARTWGGGERSNG